MASRIPVSSMLVLILAATACKVPEATSPTTPATADGANPQSSADAADGAPPNDAPVAPAGTATPPASGASPAPGVAPAVPPASNERPGPPLPELRVKSFGLHVGGAAKDTELRREVQRTLERGFSRYLDCYRSIEAPGSEGTFGADLRVAAEGGKAKVEQPRTKLRGEAFRSCMIQALESARFEPPSSGRALVVSYSVKFSFSW